MLAKSLPRWCLCVHEPWASRLRELSVALLLCSLVHLLGSQICAHYFWHIPGSKWYDETHGYDVHYSRYRLQEAQSIVNNGSIVPGLDLSASTDNVPFLCASIVTVHRDGALYLPDTIGSMLEGLDASERKRLHLNVFFANMDPNQHESWNQSWLAVVDSVTPYPKVTGSLGTKLQGFVDEHDMESKEVIDYTLAMEQCIATGAPFIAVIEDDTLFSKGWFAATVRGLADVKHKTQGTDAWLYLRLFYTEAFQGWWESDFEVDYRWHITFILQTSVLVCFMFTKKLGPRKYTSRIGYITIGVISFYLVPRMLEFYYDAGRLQLRPDNVVKMNDRGCCAQSLVFPQHQAQHTIDFLRGFTKGAVDMHMEGWADEFKLDRWALKTQVVQHMGIKSSRSAEGEFERLRPLWAHAFERLDPRALLRQHAKAMAVGLPYEELAGWYS